MARSLAAGKETLTAMRLLVVEDNRDILANLADYLALKGYEVDCARDGLTGLHGGHPALRPDRARRHAAGHGRAVPTSACEASGATRR